MDDEAIYFWPLYDVFLVLVFLGVIVFLFQQPHSRAAALLLGIPAVAGLATHYLVPGLSLLARSVLFHLVPAVFLMYTVAVILWTIFRAREVSPDAINGALGGYLLIALAFAHLYCLTEAFRPGSFHLEAQLARLPVEPNTRHNLFTYFSLATLTTVGYGDITPQSPPARMFSCIEAVLGQFYVAVIIAELIGLKVSASIREKSG
jgi:hypothetical protein